MQYVPLGAAVCCCGFEPSAEKLARVWMILALGEFTRTSISHSSCSQKSSRHQSPEVRHGPEAALTLPYTPRKKTRLGTPLRNSMVAGKRGRNMRNPVEDRRNRDSSSLASTVAITAPAFGFW